MNEGSKNKCLQSQYTTTVHRFMKGHTPPAQLDTTNKPEAQGYMFRDSHNSSRRTQHSQLRSTCHNVHSSYTCCSCCPWDDTCSLVLSLVLIFSAVVAPWSPLRCCSNDVYRGENVKGLARLVKLAMSYIMQSWPLLALIY